MLYCLCVMSHSNFIRTSSVCHHIALMRASARSNEQDVYSIITPLFGLSLIFADLKKKTLPICYFTTIYPRLYVTYKCNMLTTIFWGQMIHNSCSYFLFFPHCLASNLSVHSRAPNTLTPKLDCLNNILRTHYFHQHEQRIVPFFSVIVMHYMQCVIFMRLHQISAIASTYTTYNNFIGHKWNEAMEACLPWYVLCGAPLFGSRSIVRTVKYVCACVCLSV